MKPPSRPGGARAADERVFGRLRARVRRLASRARPKGWLSFIGRHELGSILAFCALAASALVFVKVASEVSEGELQDIDRGLLLLLRNPANIADPIGPAWVEEMGRDFSALGGVGVLTLATLAVVGYLAVLGRPRTAAFVASAVSGGALLAALLKTAFGRPRPTVVPHLSHVASSSFPSGHSMLAAAVYLSLGGLLARLEERPILRAYVLLWALGLVTLVGVSRVYLGVHWPTDVLAGWAAGAAWGALCWLLAKWLQRRGHLEGTSDRKRGPD